MTSTILKLKYDTEYPYQPSRSRAMYLLYDMERRNDMVYSGKETLHVEWYGKDRRISVLGNAVYQKILRIERVYETRGEGMA